MTRRKRWLIYGGVISVIVIAQFAFLSSIISPSPDVSKPPVEMNRVCHPLGFSIVKPGRTKELVGDDMITILPNGGRSRYTAAMSVRRLPVPPDAFDLQRDQFRAGKFQKQDAFIYIGPSGDYDVYRAITSRSDAWYEVSLIIPGGSTASGSMPSPEWQQYLNTFNAAMK